MDYSRVKNAFSPETMSRVVYLCDNLFYNNYLETGVLNSRQEIQSRIKGEVERTFVEFWGPTHAQQIHDKVNLTNIGFVYQTIGPTNSISGFLLKTKVANFNKITGANFEAPDMFATVAQLLSQNGNDIKRIIETSTSSALTLCLMQLNIRQEEILADESLAKLVANQINELGNTWTQIKYSQDPQIETNMQFLESYVSQVDSFISREIYAECMANGITDTGEIVKEIVDAKQKNFFGVRLDPLVSTLQLDGAVWDLMLRTSAVAALHDGSTHTVFFGMHPEDNTILHEFVHSVDGSGFERGHRDRGETTYSNPFRQNEMFNEAITEYFANLMMKQREKANNGRIVNPTTSKSEYSRLFDVLDSFFVAYLPELKETRLRKFPTEEFMRVIGKEQFETMSLICNELIGLNHDRGLHEWAKKEGLTIEQFLDKYGDISGDLYGSRETPISEINEQIQQSNEQFETTFDSSLKKQPTLKRLGMSVRKGSKELAERFNGSDSPHLQRFAQLLYSASDKISTFTQQHGARTLESPIESLDLFMQDSRDMDVDNEMVMTMKPNN